MSQSTSKVQIVSSSRLTGTTKTDDGSSFITARGTLSSLSPTGEIHEEDVVIWIESGTTKTAISTIRTLATVSSDSTPMPSRVLHLFHPSSPIKEQAFSDPVFVIEPWTVINDAKTEMGRALWNLVGGSLYSLETMSSGLVEWLGSIVPNSNFAILSNTILHEPSPDRSSMKLQPEPKPRYEARVYADETVCTLRIKPRGVVSPSTPDLGNTPRPILIRKRGGIPTWSVEDHRGWGRDEAGYKSGWR